MTCKALFLSIVLFFVGVPVTPTVALGAPIHDLTSEVIDQEIYISASLTGGVSAQTLREINNGIPKEIYYYLTLSRKQKRWFDEELFTKTVRLTVKYDTLKKQYAVTRQDGALFTEQRFTDFGVLQEAITHLTRVKLTGTTGLVVGHRYLIRVKAQMKTVKLPLYLDYLLFFIPFLELDTPWAQTPFVLKG